MRLKPFVLAVLGVAGLAQAAAQEGAAPTWRGTYRYEHDGGRTAGGSPIRVAYALTVVPGAARGGCLLSSRGFQSDEAIVCHAEGDAGTLSVRFHGYDDGRTVNRYGVARYKLGETLFVLRRAADGAEPLTDWEAFRPDLPADAPDPGRYFVRAR